MEEHPATGADLAQRLVALFDNARQAVAMALLESGQSLTLPQERVAVVPNPEGTGIQGETRVVETNSLELIVRPQFREALGPWLRDARVLAAELAGAFSTHTSMPLVFPGVSPDFVGLSLSDLDLGNAEQWTLAFILLPATFHYMISLSSVGSGDDSLAARVAAEVVDVLETGELIARQAIALSGIATDEDLLECGSNRIRALTALERGELLDFRYPVRRGAHLGRMPELSWPSHVLEMDRPAGRPNQIGLLPAPKLLLALQLHGISWSGPGGLVTYLQPEWLSFGRMSRPMAMPRSPGEVCPLSQSQFEAACATADRLASYRLEPPERPSELALHRFGLGCSRADAADGVLDFVVALEALLLPYDREVRYADLSYRFRLHGALFISEAIFERREFFRALQKLYDMRSRLVHGDNYPDPGETLLAARSARQLAARGLLKAVSNGFPDVAHFNRLSLGESVG